MNKQITEDYVSYKIAALLKDKGFKGKVHRWYTQYEEVAECTNIPHDYFDCPTFQMTLKWLREVHNWYIDIRFNRHYQYYIPIVYNMSGTLESITNLEERPKQYEQAVEAAIKYTLENLI